jgi:hypothetical protein
MLNPVNIISLQLIRTVVVAEVELPA